MTFFTHQRPLHDGLSFFWPISALDCLAFHYLWRYLGQRVFRTRALLSLTYWLHGQLVKLIIWRHPLSNYHTKYGSWSFTNAGWCWTMFSSKYFSFKCGAKSPIPRYEVRPLGLFLIQLFSTKLIRKVWSLNVWPSNKSILILLCRFIRFKTPLDNVVVLKLHVSLTCICLTRHLTQQAKLDGEFNRVSTETLLHIYYKDFVPQEEVKRW